MRFDTIVSGGKVALPGAEPTAAEIGIRDGRIAAISDDLSDAQADERIDVAGKLVLPGAVDAHFHIGIYRDMSQDAESETRSSAAGGVTSVISYFRTGSHYLDKSGPYELIFPEVLEKTSGHSYVDFGYHLAPMLEDQVGEIGTLVRERGVASFKYYMFYKGLDLAGDSLDAAAYTKSVTYDLGHLFMIMEAVREAQDEAPAGARVSLSIHCEQPELIRVFMERVQKEGQLTGLQAYSAGRPPLTERLAIGEVAVLASETQCAINFLHLSSADALGAAMLVRDTQPLLDVRIETTLHHLALSYESYNDQRGKVNPPIRSEADRETLWQGVVRGNIDWIVSDHACCSEENKEGELWHALPGFGGTALLYPYLLTEAPKRGVSLARIVDLAAANPAKGYGLWGRKGAISVGFDADLAIVDMEREVAVTPEVLHSAQEYTPFEGMPLVGWPVRTLLRGRTIYADGEIVGEPEGSYLPRYPGAR
jgi:dihydroorotase-like cyclic amidohydrolase